MTDPMITAPLVRLDASLGNEKEDVIRALADLAAAAGRTESADGLAADALAREATSATGLPGGIAIPHCRSEHVTVPTLVFARLSPPTDFGAKDGPADLAFLIAAPAGGDATHLQLLTKLARALVKSEFTDSLRTAATADEVVALVAGVVDPDHAPAPAAPHPAAATVSPDRPAPAPQEDRRRSLVAVTSCPTGIAHTYMAAEALEAAAQRAGVELHLETQGSAGSTPLDVATIRTADAAIFATDVGVRDRGRFAGKPVLASGVKRAIDDADAMIAEALRLADDPSAPRVEGSAGAAESAHDADEPWGRRVRRVLMTGVSYMIPFVAAGGLLIALSFLLGGYEIGLSGKAAKIMTTHTLFNLPDAGALGLHHAWGDLGAYLGAVAFTLGSTAFKFLVPALAGYIAYAIADRPGIAPGFVMGAIAVDLGGFGTPQSGFLGGIIGGVLAGLLAHWIAGWKVPAWLRGLMPVVVIPLLATLVSGAIMLIVLAKPLGSLMSGLNSGLTHMSGGGAGIALGVLLGLMMAFDMGGPLNKTAYLFATTGLGAAAAATGNAPQLEIMAAVMLAGMVPPLALALATVVRPGLFTEAERENGKAAWLLGASFITEGAIPFAAADPLRVIPSIMAGSAVTGGLSMAFHVTLRAPHGGIFVFFAVGHVLWFVLSLVAGVLVAAACVIALKSLTESRDEIDELAESAV
ncbi:MAG: PTS fructose transporter subunit IIABC [Nocardioidaceae bacterium]